MNTVTTIRCGPEGCPQCHGDLREIRTWADPKPIAYYVECTCPRPRCPICEQPLENERCASMLCPHYSLLVPVPVMA